MKQGTMVKLRILFEENTDGIEAEWVWVTALKNGYYRLENFPISSGLNFHDIVRGEYVDDMLTFRSLVIKSGYKQEEN